jgi:hypothetical protein
MVQGFLLSRPLSPEDASRLLELKQGAVKPNLAHSLKHGISAVESVL